MNNTVVAAEGPRLRRNSELPTRTTKHSDELQQSLGRSVRSSVGGWSELRAASRRRDRTWRFVSPNVPPVSITKSAFCTLASVGSCASMRASAWAAARPSRSTTRATCWLRGQLVTITRSKSRSRPVSKSSGMSTTARLSPAAASRSSHVPVASRTRGWMMASRSARACVSREHHDAEGPAIEAAVGQQDVGPEAFGHGRQAGRARGDGVARQHVGVERRDAVRGQPRADVALAGRDAAGERRAQQGHPAQPSARSPSWAAASRSSTKVFHSWQCGHCQSSSLLR